MPSNLKLNAQALVGICVHGTPNQGGVATNLGENGHLTLRVTPYRPQVRCKAPGSAPPFATCRKILDMMHADGEQRRFGYLSDPETQVRLPQRLITPERRCLLTLDTLSNSDSSDWYKIWAAGVAIEVMCVEYKKAAGVAYGLGKEPPPFLGKTSRRCTTDNSIGDKKGKDRNLMLEISDNMPDPPGPPSLIDLPQGTNASTFDILNS